MRDDLAMDRVIQPDNRFMPKKIPSRMFSPFGTEKLDLQKLHNMM